MFCKNCGKEVNDGAKFCPFCGSAPSGDVVTPTNNVNTYSPMPQKNTHMANSKSMSFEKVCALIILLVGIVVGIIMGIKYNNDGVVFVITAGIMAVVAALFFVLGRIKESIDLENLTLSYIYDELKSKK